MLVITFFKAGLIYMDLTILAVGNKIVLIKLIVEVSGLDYIAKRNEQSGGYTCFK